MAEKEHLLVLTNQQSLAAGTFNALATNAAHAVVVLYKSNIQYNLLPIQPHFATVEGSEFFSRAVPSSMRCTNPDERT